MANHLNRKVGDMGYDKLFAGITPPEHVNSGTITKLAAASTYKRGTVLEKGTDGKLYILGTNAANVPDSILCDDTDIGTAADEVAAIYTAGCFNVDALIIKDGYTMTEANKDKLRERSIYLASVHE